MPAHTNPTHLAVIGHSNTGKTSLLRTLMRDDDFGEVKNAAATTRHVTQVAIYAQDTAIPLVSLSDTPGLEDATGVMDYIAAHTDERDDGVDRLCVFLDKVAQGDGDVQDFSQEAKAIKALLSADIALYVIDARVSPTARYKDELAILVMAAVPILPVFNFIKDSQFMATWQSLLARRGLHVASLFDTVAFDFDNEMTLWQHLITLSSMLTYHNHHQVNLTTLKNERQATWHSLLEAGNLLIADFLVNVASFYQKIGENDDPDPFIHAMQDKVRHGEKLVMDKLLTLYRFYRLSWVVDTPAIGLLQSDPFDRHQLGVYGIRAVSGGGIGAMLGVGIDVATLGASLGLGTVVGSLLGGGLANAHVIKDKLTKTKRLSVDDTTLLVLANRLMDLHHTLRHTGHAQKTALTTHAYHPWQNLDPIAKIIQKARQKAQDNHLSWIDLIKNLDNRPALRQDLTAALASTITASLQANQGKL